MFVVTPLPTFFLIKKIKTAHSTRYFTVAAVNLELRSYKYKNQTDAKNMQTEKEKQSYRSIWNRDTVLISGSRKLSDHKCNSTHTADPLFLPSQNEKLAAFDPLTTPLLATAVQCMCMITE